MANQLDAAWDESMDQIQEIIEKTAPALALLLAPILLYVNAISFVYHGSIATTHTPFSHFNLITFGILWMFTLRTLGYGKFFYERLWLR